MDIDKKKEKLLEDFIKMSEGKGSEDMLPLLLAFSNKAKKEGISFSKEETIYLIDKISVNLPPEKQSQIKMLTQMMF